MTTVTSVSILGLGQMGTALAKALLKAGHKLTVWNRSVGRTVALAQAGAGVAPTVQAAVQASDLLILCVADYAAAEAILTEASADDGLSGKTIIQLTTVGVGEVMAQQTFAHRHSARFLAGGMLASPDTIGSPDAVIVYAGLSDVFESSRAVLSDLGGALRYLGSDPRLAVAAYLTVGVQIIGIQSLFYETAAVAQRNGIALEDYLWLTRLVTSQSELAIQDGITRIASGRYHESQANINLLRAFMSDATKVALDSGVSTPITSAILAQLTHGMQAGCGDQDLARIFDLLTHIERHPNAVQ